MENTLVVLLHGAWHSSAHWAATQRELAALGVASAAVDLPGHGVDAPVPSGYFAPGQPGLDSEKSALADLTLGEAADTVLDLLAAARPRFPRVVLVAHSAGGATASAAVERAPELVDHLVYLSAFVPAGRPRFLDYITAPENADAIIIPSAGDPEVLGAVRINPLSPDPDHVATIRRALLDDLPADAPDGWRALLHPDLPLAIPSTPVEVTPQRWGRVRRTYVRLLDDLALPLVTQDLMIAESDARTPDDPFEVRTLPGGHSPFAVRPRALAALLAQL
ncbi:alpha/beta fold hydrolase [Actinokineospora bangkokensis]|uniref:Alpha/beta hydrolase n=1 Tax=Actinokineospora bangkokensis TaxID=1193682 RepID=A0A1Q9LLR1_9PSEU|nr:alpha/beta fold hydrolase [Actinokineospora bangkokensis]OLR92976.1 alpha/beta hydrolase [Actinokineospora bangkokensis]